MTLSPSRRWKPVLAGVGSLLLFAACQSSGGGDAQLPSGPPSQTEVEEFDRRVQDHFRKLLALPPQVTIRLADLAPAEGAPGLLLGRIEVSQGEQVQKVPVIMSRNGRFIVQGSLIDLLVDPAKGAMDKLNLANLPARGNPNATVTIVEFIDFQCVFCEQAYHLIEDEVLKAYGDRVRFVVKNFPLSDLHPWAVTAAAASVCARQQSGEAFWKVFDYFYQHQSSIDPGNLTEKLQTLAKEAGMDTAAFTTCMDTKAGVDVVNADVKEGVDLGVRSTPTFFINGRKLEGAQPLQNFKNVLDDVLKEAGQ